MLLNDSSKMKFARQNILFSNKDIQLIAKLEETRFTLFSIATNVEMFSDSVVINNLDISIVEDTIIGCTGLLLNDCNGQTIHVRDFKKIPSECQSNPYKTIFFEYPRSPTSDKIELYIYLDYSVGNSVFADTIKVEGLTRIRSKKQLIPLH